MTAHKPDQPRIQSIPIRSRRSMDYISDAEVEQIHQATLSVLNEVGVRFPLQRALDTFAAAGARVDFDTRVVKIDADLLMDTLAKAPRFYTMGGRENAGLDLPMDGTRIHCGTTGTGTDVFDVMEKVRRPARKSDIAQIAKIVDYLPQVGFFWAPVAPQDHPSETFVLHEMEASFTHTGKHIMTASCVNKEHARYLVEMARVVAGSKANLRARPPITLIASPVSPLGHEAGTLEAALTFAEAGLPVGFATMPVLGLTAPASIAGTMVTGNAEILSAVCLLQLLYPGTPVAYPLFTGMMNPYSGGLSVSASMTSSFYAGTVKLGHYYNLPVMSTFGGSDFNEPDSWKVGRDDAIDAYMIAATGPDMFPCLGLSDGYLLLTPEKLLLDVDIIDYVCDMIDGIPVDPAALALDEIRAVGPGGHFMDREFTAMNIRRLWKPGVPREWSSAIGDFIDIRQAGREKVQWILENHQPEPLEEVKRKEIKQIIRDADRDLLS
jgi:trimethylamine:corrinoid methyltransferase-like protein